MGAETVLARKIVSIGCHHGNGTCYVQLDGAPFGGGEGCATGPTHEFRWDNAETADGRRTYASMMAAYLQQKKVGVSIVGCSSQSVPSLSYYRLYD